MNTAPRPLRVVVAEDDDETRAYFLDLLSGLGHHAAGARDGQQLIELARLTEPDLIVADIMMPDTDGIKAAEEINRHREVPVILVSAHHDQELLRRAAADHVMAYLVKPVRGAELQAAVSLAMARFEHYLALRRETRDLRQALEDRKVLERAKGVVMRRLRVEEQEAFRRMKKLASDRNWKLADVARTILTAEEIFQDLERV